MGVLVGAKKTLAGWGGQGAAGVNSQEDLRVLELRLERRFADDGRTVEVVVECKAGRTTLTVTDNRQLAHSYPVEPDQWPALTELVAETRVALLGEGPGPRRDPTCTLTLVRDGIPVRRGWSQGTPAGWESLERLAGELFRLARRVASIGQASVHPETVTENAGRAVPGIRCDLP